MISSALATCTRSSPLRISSRLRPSHRDNQHGRYPPTGSHGIHIRSELPASAQPSRWAIEPTTGRGLSACPALQESRVTPLHRRCRYAPERGGVRGHRGAGPRGRSAAADHRRDASRVRRGSSQRSHRVLEASAGRAHREALASVADDPCPPPAPVTDRRSRAQAVGRRRNVAGKLSTSTSSRANPSRT
jgi:hypothetical protein